MGQINKASQEIICDFFAESEPRKYTRFHNSLGTSIELDLLSENLTVICCLKCLVINDSLGGCNVVVATKTTIISSQFCNLKIKGLKPILAKIVWLKKLEESIFQLGIEYQN